jgi:hypothetical protein
MSVQEQLRWIEAVILAAVLVLVVIAYLLSRV